MRTRKLNQRLRHDHAWTILASAAIGTAAAMTARPAHAGQLFSFEDRDNITVFDTGGGSTTFLGGIDPAHTQYTKNGVLSYDEQNAWVWGDSYQSDANHEGTAGLNDHTRSTIGVTDGSYSMLVHDPDGNFATATQIVLNSGTFNPDNLNAKFNDLTTGTKILFDISTPGAPTPNGLPDYEVDYMAVNYAAGYLTSYNLNETGNNYQYASGPAAQTALTTQTYVWDLGGQMQAVAGSLWPSLSNYVILHLSSNSPAGPAADYYYDNLRVIHEDTTVTPTWTGTGAGNWTDGARWQHGVPNSIGAEAIFYGAGDGGVSVNSAVTVGSIVFDSQRTSYTGIGPNGNVTSADDPDMPPITNYTLSGSGTLTLDVANGVSEIYVVAGSHNINVPVTVNDSLDIDMSAGFGPDNNPSLPGGGRFTNVPMPSLNFGSLVTLSSAVTLNKRGLGTVSFAAIRGAGSLSVSGGTVKINSNDTPNKPDGASVVQSLSISPSAHLDLTNNSMVIDYTGPVGTLVDDTRLMLKNGQLTSSSADSQHRLGFGDNAVLHKTDFAGQTPDDSSILIKFTYGGDANLDGQVDVTDLGALATNWQTSNVWTGGDFNYDGFVDVTDLGILATDWQLGVGSPLGPGSLQAALASVGLGNVAVPEPASIGAIGICLAAAASRRRRRYR